MAELKLISPDDRSPLRQEGNEMVDSFGNRYAQKNGAWVLTPKKPILKGTMEYHITPHEYFRKYPYAKSLKPLFPEQQLSKGTAQGDLQIESLFGYIPKAEGVTYCLDHGCGAGRMKKIFDPIGYTYVGVDNEVGTSTEQGGGTDYQGGATHYCDLHRLPFADNIFQFTVSYSVFEHLQNPFLAASELYRVMKPGGIGFIAIADLIPFHMDSFYHHTHFGTLALLKNAGFDVLQVAGANWNGYEAIGAMDGMPGPKFIRNFVGRTAARIHERLWKMRAKRKGRDWEKENIKRHNMMAGIMKAVVRKPE